MRFSFRKKKTKRRRRAAMLVSLLLLLGCLLAAVSFFSAKRSLNAAEQLMLKDRFAEAGEKIRKAASPVFFKKSWLELSALLDLLEGRQRPALPKLERLKRVGSGTVVPYAAFCKYFFDRAQYQNLRAYTEYLLPRQTDAVWWYRALSQAAFLDAAGAAATVKRLSPVFRSDNAKALALLQRVIAQMQKGHLTYIYDRQGEPLANFDLGTRTTQPLVSGIRFPEFDGDFKSGVRFYHLAMDRRIQERVTRLFEDFFGTFVLLDVKDNGILAAYSKPRESRRDNAAFDQEFEPGSVVKVLTLLAYLRFSKHELFPFQCRGPMNIGGRLFYDALAHGEVKDFSEAVALSCNLSFARMGMDVGSKRLSEVLQKFFFNAEPFTDLFLRFKTGRFQAVGHDAYRLANLSVGLDEISLTTLQAALIASIISEDGSCSPPYLIDHISNILDLGVYNHPQHPERLFTDGLLFRKIRMSMLAAVEQEKGTARRAKTAGITVAAKTGTAGTRQRGLDAVVIGFFPAQDPQYAFAFRLEGGGRAEFNGALVLSNFLKTFVTH